MEDKATKNIVKRKRKSAKTFKKGLVQIKKLQESTVSKHSGKETNKTVFDKHSRREILGVNSLEKDEEELALEQLVFGGESDVIENLKIVKHQKGKTKKKKKSKLSNSGSHLEDENIFSSENESENDANEEVRKPVWEDEDDDEILVQDKVKTLKWCHRSVEQKGSEKYKDYAKEKFLKISGTPKWAELGRKDNSSDSQEESEEELLQKTTNFLQQSTSLPQGTINIQKCPYLNDAEREHTIIKSVEFHPKARVALVAGYSGTTTLFQVDGKTNAKIQSVHFEKFPIYTAHFSVDGNQIVVGSKEYGHFYYYDMIAGKIVKVPWDRGMDQRNVRRFQMCPDGKLIAIHGRYGNIHLVTTHTKEWIETLKMNGEVLAIAFNRDGSRMFSYGDTGQVYVWDMSSRQCIHRFNDEGCIIGTSLTLSPNEQYLVTGSDSGIVNVYDTADLLNSIDPKPVKTLKNLVTEITSLKFNSTSEILTMASAFKPNALKLVHFPSMTVFSNFPIQYKAIQHPDCLDMSLNSGFLAVGNNVGVAHLFRLTTMSDNSTIQKQKRKAISLDTKIQILDRLATGEYSNIHRLRHYGNY